MNKGTVCVWYVITAKKEGKQYFLHKIDDDGRPVWHSNYKQAKGWRNPEQVKVFVRHNDLGRVEIKGRA